MRLRSIFVAMLLLAPVAAWAQTANGTITGLVSDPTGAVVANAMVEARNTDTGFLYSATTTNTGNYTIVQVPVGPYSLSVGVPQFKRYTRDGLVLAATQVMRIDIVLEVGATTESVTVTADASLLKTENGATVENVTIKQLQELPILVVGGGGLSAATNGFRDPYAVARLVPGVRYTPAASMIVNGSPGNTFNFLIEGQTANLTSGAGATTTLVQPSVDAVQEVAVMTSNFAAEYGAVGGGLFNITMRSGTNSYHGSGYDYMANDFMNAAQPYSGLKTTQRRNDFGGTFGGPLRIPKLYNGRNKTFFFFNFEQYIENVNVRSTSATVPLTPYRTGDFSQLITLSGTSAGPRNVLVGGKNYVDPRGNTVLSGAIFDPTTTVPVTCPPSGSNCTPGSTYQVRSAFVGNKIPTSYLDPVALNILALVPLPKGPNADLGQPSSNYQNPFLSHRASELPSLKLDQQVGSKGHASFYWHSTRTETEFNYPNGGTLGLPVPIDPGRGSWSQGNNYRANYDYTMTPTLLLHAGIGYTSENFVAYPPDFNYNAVTSLGLRGATLNAMFPVINTVVSTTLGGMTGLGSTSGSTGTTEHRPAANFNMSWVKQNHTFKFGGEWSLIQYPTKQITGTNGVYGFGGGTIQSALDGVTTSQGTTGFALADFLMGDVNSISLSVPASFRTQKQQSALFAQDTWKLTRKLTLDYGLRWDYGTYAKEQYGRNANFSPFVPNASAGGHPGGSVFEATCGCSFASNYPLAFGPRVGIAYRIDSKTVLRAGFGIVYSRTSSSAGAATTSASGGSPGFGQWLFQLKDGIPSSVHPQWPVYDANVGQAPNTVVAGPALLDPNSGRPPRQAQWSVGVQREVTRNLVVEVSYVANRGVWWTAPLSSENDISTGLLAQYGFQVGNTADSGLLTAQWGNLTTAQKSTLAARGVSIPYSGFPLTQTVRQSLRPFPQYSGSINPGGAPLGKTWYDSAQIVVTKRLSHGLSLNANYTYSKTLDLMSSPDIFNTNLGKNLSGSDLPHQFQLSANYVVPTLRNGLLGNKIISTVLSDWGMGWYLQYQSAAILANPISTGVTPISNWLGRGPGPAQLKTDANGKFMSPYAVNWTDYSGKVHPEPLDINCHCYNPQTTVVLNPNAWTNVPDGQWANDESGLRFYRGYRSPNENVNFSRNFRLKEGIVFQIRAEFQNAFNRLRLPSPATGAGAGFSSPTTQVGGIYTGGFGVVTPTSGGGVSGMRSGTLIGRLTF